MRKALIENNLNKISNLKKICLPLRPCKKLSVPVPKKEVLITKIEPHKKLIKVLQIKWFLFKKYLKIN